MRLSFVFVVAGVALPLFGCEGILGIKNRVADTVGGADGGVATASDFLEGCTLASNGNGRVRVGDLVPSTERYDVCLKAEGKSGYDDVTPLISSSGAACARGVGYKQITVPIGVAPGAYDVKVVAAGNACNAAAVATQNQLLVDDSNVVALYLVGDGQGPPTLLRLGESRPAQVTASKIRLIHAGVGAPAIDFGFADVPRLPSKLVGPLILNTAFGTRGDKGGSSALDANGYRDLQAAGAPLSMSVAASGTQDSLVPVVRKFNAGSSYTAMLVGTQDRPAFPLELVACDEMKGQGALIECTNAPAQSLSVETLNTQLTGIFSLASDARPQPLINNVGTSEADVLCLTEVWSDADKRAIAEAAKSRFPHSYFAETNWDTPIDDPRDQSGATPATRTTGMCAGAALSRMDTFLDCIRDNCAAPQGSEDAAMPPGSSSCINAKCVDSVGPLLFGTDDEKRCWSCILSQLQAPETVGFTRQACGTDPKAWYAFRGASGAMVLSKRPIEAPEFVSLPATEWRVSVLRTPVTMDNGATVDVYCGGLTTPAADCLIRPYVGFYGGGKTCEEAWVAELTLQTERLADLVRTRSTSLRRKAIVAGEFYAGPGYNDGTKDILTPRYVSAFNSLTKSFVVAVPEGYAPSCTLCSTNPLFTGPGSAPTGESTWTSNVFLGQIPVTATRSATTTFTAPVIDHDPGNGSPKIPLSPYYGFRTTVRIDP